MEPVPHRVAVGIGSNVGDRAANLQGACDHLRRLHAGGAFRVSRVYETEPVDSVPDAARFLNAVIEFGYAGLPAVLLDALQSVEHAMGRPSKRPRNAPRTIDLDILYFGNLTLNNGRIIIPHPRLHLRRFVLAPLAEISPERIIPGQSKTIAELLGELPEIHDATLSSSLLDPWPEDIT